MHGVYCDCGRKGVVRRQGSDGTVEGEDGVVNGVGGLRGSDMCGGTRDCVDDGYGECSFDAIFDYGIYEGSTFG